MSEYYPWLKAAHIVSMVAWMAANLYLPRLFVYHAGAAVGSELSETLKIMERRLLRGIMNPAMVLTWIFGLWMAFDAGWFTDGSKWLHIKLALVLVLSGFHGACSYWRRQFANDKNVHSANFYRMMNEFPTLILIAVVILVVLKPF